MGAKLGQNNVKGEQTKLAILESADQVFAEGGYRGSSLAAVAERAGVTQSGLLHHFRTKEDLLQSLLSRHEAADDAMLLRAVRRPGIGVVDGLGEMIARSAADRVAVRLLAVLVAEGTTVEHPAHEYMRGRYEKLRNRLVGALASGVERAEIRPDVDLERLATVLVAVLDGLQLQWIYNPDIDMERAFDLLRQVLADALCPRPDAG